MHQWGPPTTAYRRAGREGDLPGGVDRALLRRVWAFARPYRGRLVVFLVTITAGALVTLAPPLLFRRIIDDAIPSGDRRLVALLGLATVLVALASTGLDLVQRWYSSAIGEGLIFDLRVSLYDHVQRMPLAFFTRTQTGSLISRMNNDVIGAQRALTGTLGQVVFNLFTLVSTLVVMALLEWRLTLLALVILPAFIVPAKRVGAKLQDLTRQGMDVNASMNTTMAERLNVSGAMLVKLFGRHDDEVTSFSRSAGQVRDIGIKSALYGRIFFAALGLVAAVGTALVYWLGAQMVISGELSLGDLTALALLVTRIYGPLTSLTNARVDVLLALVSFDRVFELLDTERMIDDAPDAAVLTDPVGLVELDAVTFRYPSAAEVSVASLEGEGAAALPLDARVGVDVLSDVTLTARPGSLIALVGPSGAGKSTLASLVPRLYDVTGGAVRIDGVDVRTLTQASLRAAVGVVSQDPHLFHDTVRNNLRYARPGAGDEELEAACRAAQVHHVIAALPDGYDTTVGERGYRLSGGEKQRLAIARVLLKDPAVVILDEATSHLDAENEHLVQQALGTALAGRTSLVIAHRLSTVQDADEIVVLDAGRIVERGTHPELLAAGGLYAELYHTLVRDQRAPV
ncbi:MAG: ABC transporter ATP-binding protein/permease [Actinomycetota bacterium]|nr:ABC transporter ATP-binding protein/permease [Actinomycetota bacterium]